MAGKKEKKTDKVIKVKTTEGVHKIDKETGAVKRSNNPPKLGPKQSWPEISDPEKTGGLKGKPLKEKGVKVERTGKPATTTSGKPISIEKKGTLETEGPKRYVGKQKEQEIVVKQKQTDSPNTSRALQEQHQRNAQAQSERLQRKKNKAKLRKGVEVEVKPVADTTTKPSQVHTGKPAPTRTQIWREQANIEKGMNPTDAKAHANTDIRNMERADAKRTKYESPEQPKPKLTGKTRAQAMNEYNEANNIKEEPKATAEKPKPKTTSKPGPTQPAADATTKPETETAKDKGKGKGKGKGSKNQGGKSNKNTKPKTPKTEKPTVTQTVKNTANKVADTISDTAKKVPGSGVLRTAKKGVQLIKDLAGGVTSGAGMGAAIDTGLSIAPTLADAPIPVVSQINQLRGKGPMTIGDLGRGMEENLRSKTGVSPFEDIDTSEKNLVKSMTGLDNTMIMRGDNSLRDRAYIKALDFANPGAEARAQRALATVPEDEIKARQARRAALADQAASDKERLSYLEQSFGGAPISSSATSQVPPRQAVQPNSDVTAREMARQASAPVSNQWSRDLPRARRTMADGFQPVMSAEIATTDQRKAANPNEGLFTPAPIGQPGEFIAGIRKGAGKPFGYQSPEQVAANRARVAAEQAAYGDALQLKGATIRDIQARRGEGGRRGLFGNDRGDGNVDYLLRSRANAAADAAVLAERTRANDIAQQRADAAVQKNQFDQDAATSKLYLEQSGEGAKLWESDEPGDRQQAEMIFSGLLDGLTLDSFTKTDEISVQQSRLVANLLQAAINDPDNKNVWEQWVSGIKLGKEVNLSDGVNQQEAMMIVRDPDFIDEVASVGMGALGDMDFKNSPQALWDALQRLGGMRNKEDVLANRRQRVEAGY